MFPSVIRLHLPHTPEREVIALAQIGALAPYHYTYLPTGDLVKEKSFLCVANKIIRSYDPRHRALFEAITLEHVEELRAIIDSNMIPPIETLLAA